MFFCVKCFRHLGDMLRIMVNGLNEKPFFLDVQKTFIAKLKWSKQTHYFVPSIDKCFFERLFCVEFGSISKWKAEKNGLVHNCVFFKKSGERMAVFSKSDVYNDVVNGYGLGESLEKFLIDSFVDCPLTINGEAIRNNLNGALCYKEFENIDFDDSLIDDDMCQSEKHMYLKRYFHCIVIY